MNAMSWQVLASRDVLPRVLGCEAKLYADKSIIEKVRTQGKITMTGLYTNKAHYNARYIFAA